jgi:acyl-CoA synthetase (AMP-forming)/AMP-acid ligase II
MTDHRIHSLFDQRLQESPDRPFLLLSDTHMSYADLGAWVALLVQELLDDGVRLGDRVMIVAENCPEHVALILACSRVGAWSCGVNARMAPGEIKAFVEKADPRVTYFTSSASDAARQHGVRDGVKHSVITGLQRSAVRVSALAEQDALLQRVAAVIFTSGTTGAPKGVLVTHAGLLQFARLSAQSRALGPDDLSYACLPMTHIFGLGTVLMASLYAGAALVMRSRFDPADVFDSLSRVGVSNLQGPPAMFTRLLAWLDEVGIDQPDCARLRYVYTGAAPLDMALKQAVEARFGQPLHHGYGLSEYAGALCLTTRGIARDDLSAGYPVEGAELRIVDSQGCDAPNGERGEIWMRGIGLMPGYLGDAAATTEVMRTGGWYASGDLGYLAADGALFVVGRLKEMIIRSGFNVYPGEIEAVLNSFEGIQRSAVIGRREPDGNEKILAFVEPVTGAEINLVALQDFLQENLAPYKRPAQVVPIAALPMTHSGKVLKRSLLELYPQP